MRATVMVGDPTRLAQALLNYLSNAVKSTERGTITLRVRVAEETTTESLLHFEVEDTGIGIDPETIAKLFEAFEQVDTTSSRRFGGTGLGLAITRRLAHLMGGQAGAQSSSGLGSTFWFTAHLGKSRLGIEQLSELAEAPDSVRTDRRSVPKGCRILLAEDNRINQEIVVELLTGVGLKVDIANNGYEALEMSRKGNYDLILMNMQMPGMDGLEATRAIRQIPDFAATPILAMTANAFDEDRRACQEAGMNDFVIKPLNPDALINALQKWLMAPHPEPSPPHSKETPASPLTDASTWTQRMERIPGLDIQAGLEMVRGEAEKYERMLALFRSIHVQDATHLVEALNQNDRDALGQLAHALKALCRKYWGRRRLPRNRSASLGSPWQCQPRQACGQQQRACRAAFATARRYSERSKDRLIHDAIRPKRGNHTMTMQPGACSIKRGIDRAGESATASRTPFKAST